MPQKSSDCFVRNVTKKPQEPPGLKLPKFCQVCESTEDLVNISPDADVVKDLGSVLVIRDKRVGKLMKYLCLDCHFKLCGIVEFRKQYETTYQKYLAQIECNETEVVVQLEKLVVISTEKEPVMEATEFEGNEESYNEINPTIPKEYSEDIRMCAKDTQVDKRSTNSCENKSKATFRTHIVKHVQKGKSKKRASVPQKGKLQHICAVCGYNAKYRGHLNTHMLTHKGEKPHKCTTCGQDFTQKGNLKNHMRTHTGEKPFICGICSKSFCQKGTLKKHMVIHTGERPHKCTKCDKDFAHKESLNIHMLTHTGEEMPHKCTKCGKGFSVKTSLNKHMLIHTGEKLYICGICSKSFNQKNNLKTHMMIHTGEKPHKCTKCGQDFTQKGSLNSHMKRYHPKN